MGANVFRPGARHGRSAWDSLPHHNAIGSGARRVSWCVSFLKSILKGQAAICTAQRNAILKESVQSQVFHERRERGYHCNPMLRLELE